MNHHANDHNKVNIIHTCNVQKNSAIQKFREFVSVAIGVYTETHSPINFYTYIVDLYGTISQHIVLFALTLHVRAIFITISLQFHTIYVFRFYFVTIFTSNVFNGGRELIRTNRGRGGTCSQISKHGSFAKKYETRAS